MGMINEAIAGENAKQLEGIILDLIKGERWKDCRSAARGIAKEKLYQWYLNECSDAFIEVNPEILNEFGKSMISNNFLLAKICNDTENYLLYKIEGNKCYYKDEYIGDIDEKFNVETGVLDVYFKPVKAIESIVVNITILPTGVEFKS